VQKEEEKKKKPERRKGETAVNRRNQRCIELQDYRLRRARPAAVLQSEVSDVEEERGREGKRVIPSAILGTS